ncbi:MAG TPA: hypothetical protein VNH53_02325 [Sphingomicrobium sp.]|jgi:hypothetical protein|nr:hypothetical protein [Sphingomicrobium sp.]
MRKMMMAAALALGTASIATPAAAQQVTGGLVNVTVGDVILQDILSDNEIDILRNANILNNNQLVVQAPISVAAAVCNIPVNVLASQKNTTFAGGCTAQSGSDALARVIRQRHVRRAQ